MSIEITSLYRRFTQNRYGCESGDLPDGQDDVSQFDYLQYFIRSRPVRLALALTLIAAGGWAFLPYVAYRVAPSAFVNAELVRVAAPMSGRLTRDLPSKGDFIKEAANVPLIAALSPDRRHLFDLERHHAVAKERAELAGRQLAEITDLDRELANRTEAYRNGMIQRLAQELEETTAERTGCLAEVQKRREVGSRMEQLVKSGIASEIRTAEALATQAAVSTRCEMAAARLQRLQIELNSAKNGVFLRDGANDVPYSQQQRDRLLLRRQELETQVLEEGSRSTRIAAEITEERARIDRLSRSDLFLPASHVVWAVAASPGSTVTEGQILLDLASCERRFMAVELPERDFEQIKAGDFASVRLIGSDEWHQGTVRQVRGSAARTDDRLLAAQVPVPNPGSITVEVALPPQDSPAQQNSFCNIGRLAEVRFAGRFGALGDLGRRVARLFSGRTETAINAPSSK
jgi:multidrug resistance efflux pump